MSSASDAENGRFMSDVDSGLLRGGVDADADDAKRARVLVMLAKLTQHFVNREAPRIGATHTWALVKPFGSSAIGGHLAGGDLDVCALVPSYVPRMNFFEEYPKLLSEFSSVSDVVAVVDARVQLLKFRMHGFEIDMVLATLNSPEPPTDEELMDVTIFDRTGPESRISLNGIRTALVFQSMLKQADADVFAVVLKAIKTWAKARRIYGHNFAFISSVGFAVLVLLVVLTRPHDTAAALFRAFFATYSERFAKVLSEPKKVVEPISLVTNHNPYPQYYRRWQGLPDTWEPDRNTQGINPVEPLVVINPAYPYVNSCYTTSITAFYIFAMELRKAHYYLTHCKPTDRYPWRLLVDPAYDMSKEYKDFVVVTVSSGDNDGFAEYCGFIESKVKCLWYAAESGGLDARLFNGRLPNLLAPPEVERSSLFVLGVRPTAHMEQGSAAYAEAIQCAIAEFQFAISSIPADTMSRARRALPVSAKAVMSDATDPVTMSLYDAVANVLSANHGPAQLDELAASPVRRHRAEI